uniref:Uncharacterized protein n=1 Tax=Setaria digitata TaxID=48799 RepID=A0A915PUX6_9BILA
MINTERYNLLRLEESRDQAAEVDVQRFRADETNRIEIVVH